MLSICINNYIDFLRRISNNIKGFVLAVVERGRYENKDLKWDKFFIEATQII